MGWRVPLGTEGGSGGVTERECLSRDLKEVREPGAWMCLPGQASSLCKGPEVGPCRLMCWRKLRRPVWLGQSEQTGKEEEGGQGGNKEIGQGLVGPWQDCGFPFDGMGVVLSREVARSDKF